MPAILGTPSPAKAINTQGTRPPPIDCRNMQPRPAQARPSVVDLANTLKQALNAPELAALVNILSRVEGVVNALAGPGAAPTPSPPAKPANEFDGYSLNAIIDAQP